MKVFGPVGSGNLMKAGRWRGLSVVGIVLIGALVAIATDGPRHKQEALDRELFRAVVYFQSHTVEKTLAAGADPNGGPHCSWLETYGEEDLSTTQLCRTAVDYSCLDWAVEHGDEDTARALLDKGANGLDRAVRVWGPLKSAEFYEFLLSHKVSRSVINEKFVEIADVTDAVTVKVFIAHGADVNYRNEVGWTPLSRAKECENKTMSAEIVALLKKAGARE